MLWNPRSVSEVQRQRTSNRRSSSVMSHEMQPPRKKIAIIGSGCSGLGAAWALRDSDLDVHIFEKSNRLGGHTNTQIWRKGSYQTPVDTGFIVMNTATYPNFIRFLEHVGVETRETEMTFGVSRDQGQFEWSGEGQGVFAQRRNFFRLQHWRMLFDIVRFNQFALDLLADDDEDALDRPGSSLEHRRASQDLTIGEYLDREGYSRAFRDDYLIPMTAAVWSTSPDKASLDFPAQTLIRFMWNHHLLSTIATRPAWLTIPGGSQRYIDAIVKGYNHQRLHTHLSCTVTKVLRPQLGADHGVTMSWIDPNGAVKIDIFDHVIFACHGDQILPMLGKHDDSSSIASIRSDNRRPSKEMPKQIKVNGSLQSNSTFENISEAEQDILSSFKTTSNKCYLHSDLSLMPRRRKCWTAWNYLIESTPSELPHPAGVSLTYCMNILQHISEKTYGPVLVTMNPQHKPDENLVQGEFVYEHPLYTKESVRAQKRLRDLQNKRGVSYCGAWTNYGFHEDGFSSGVKVAIEHFGAQLPFDFVDSTYSRGHKPRLSWKDNIVRLILLAILIGIRMIERMVAIPGIATIVAIGGVGFTALVDVAEHSGLLDIV